MTILRRDLFSSALEIQLPQFDWEAEIVHECEQLTKVECEDHFYSLHISCLYQYLYTVDGTFFEVPVSHLSIFYDAFSLILRYTVWNFSYKTFQQYKNIENYKQEVLYKNKHLKSIFESENIIINKKIFEMIGLTILSLQVTFMKSL